MNTRYENIRLIGRGSFGIAHLCMRKCDNQQVVVKQIPADEMDAQDQKTAQNEVKILSILNHPNIIQYYDSFIEHRAFHIVMEHADSGTLHEYLVGRNGILMKLEKIMYLFCQMVLGLEHIHSRKIIHRDIKPRNIMLSGSQQIIVKIGDFGISKILESKSKASTQLGTQSYWPPELCEGQRYNQASDIWALGCVLYEMLTLRRAFEATNLVALALKIMRGDVETYDEAVYPEPSLEALLAATMHRDPSQRPDVRGVKVHPAVIPHLYALQVDLGRIS